MSQAGYKRNAHLASSAHLSITRERLEGYKAALVDNKIPVNESFIKYCNHGGMIHAEMQNAVWELMQLKNRPDAIFCAGDRLTIGGLTAMKSLGIRIPDDVALVGFTNSALVELIDPSLTAIKQPAFEMGQAATELLIKLIESKRPVTEFETVVLQTEIFIRDSTPAISQAKNIKTMV